IRLSDNSNTFIYLCTLYIVQVNYMSYIEIKTINGKKYRYERTSYRIGKKVKHRSKYLCPVEPKTKKDNN
ncbi:MAG: hypothetical protein KAR87_06725, partial [Candidatus Aenigmarchaeota archaeon]|nr:hypothetical protein [Candidatus Aenigmarchaeota archaeon]